MAFPCPTLRSPCSLPLLAFGYLLGSIPFGLLLTRFAGLGDIRAIGSNNIGATNVLRTGRKDLAAATLVLDALKGTAAVLIAAHWGQEAAMAAALGAFLGHLFPVWLGFRGRQGRRDLYRHSPGLCLAGGPGLRRHLDRGGLDHAFLLALGPGRDGAHPAVLWGLSLPAIASLFLLLTAITWFKHHANIRRLLAGEETKIGADKSAAAKS